MTSCVSIITKPNRELESCEGRVCNFGNIHLSGHSLRDYGVTINQY